MLETPHLQDQEACVSPLMESACQNIARLKTQVDFGAFRLRVNGAPQFSYYPEDLHRLFTSYRQLAAYGFDPEPNIKFFPLGVWNQSHQLRMQTLQPGEVGYSAGFEICQCILSVASDGSVVPLHLSPLFIATEIANYAPYVQTLRTARRIIVVGYDALAKLELLCSVIGRDNVCDFALPIKDSSNCESIKHDVTVVNANSSLEVRIGYSHVAWESNYFSWLKRV